MQVTRKSLPLPLPFLSSLIHLFLLSCINVIVDTLVLNTEQSVSVVMHMDPRVKLQTVIVAWLVLVMLLKLVVLGILLSVVIIILFFLLFCFM